RFAWVRSDECFRVGRKEPARLGDRGESSGRVGADGLDERPKVIRYPRDLVVWCRRADEAERADPSAQPRACLHGEMTASGPADDGNIIDADLVDNHSDVGGDPSAGRVMNGIGSAVAGAIDRDQACAGLCRRLGVWIEQPRPRIAMKEEHCWAADIPPLRPGDTATVRTRKRVIANWS